MLRIEMPPLTDIPEDMPWLWDQVLQEAMRRASRTVENARMVTASRTILPLLRRESLPGNMRDLLVAAYRMTAAMDDAFDPMPPDKAVEYRMAGLAHPTVHCGDAMEKVLRRFLDRRLLDPCIQIAREIGHVTALRRGEAVHRQRGPPLRQSSRPEAVGGV